MAADDTMPEREVVATLAAALQPVEVHWGYAPFESSSMPPTLPIVAVQRLNYSPATFDDMCTPAVYLGECILVVDTWGRDYETARGVSAQVRSAMVAQVPGWKLQNENDLYEPNFHAWRVQGQWVAYDIVAD
jgi:hypothetical protein